MIRGKRSQREVRVVRACLGGKNKSIVANESLLIIWHDIQFDYNKKDINN